MKFTIPSTRYWKKNWRRFLWALSALVSFWKINFFRAEINNSDQMTSSQSILTTPTFIDFRENSFYTYFFILMFSYQPPQNSKRYQEKRLLINRSFYWIIFTYHMFNSTKKCLLFPILITIHDHQLDIKKCLTKCFIIPKHIYHRFS